MASPGGTSEEHLRSLMNQKRLKWMLSNRESARRSRMRRQRHLEELVAAASWLRKEKSRLLTALGLTKQHRSAVEAQNCALMAQLAELGSRLLSLDVILGFPDLSYVDAGGSGLRLM